MAKHTRENAAFGKSGNAAFEKAETIPFSKKQYHTLLTQTDFENGLNRLNENLCV
jgi:hypothetical protein